MRRLYREYVCKIVCRGWRSFTLDWWLYRPPKMGITDLCVCATCNFPALLMRPCERRTRPRLSEQFLSTRQRPLWRVRWLATRRATKIRLYNAYSQLWRVLSLSLVLLAAYYATNTFLGFLLSLAPHELKYMPLWHSALYLFMLAHGIFTGKSGTLFR